ncbi:VanZ family protein [Streptomyces sp. NPDC006527]|uniref:VanZ family protein n=1 Tax=Streptomyces sp. NPDC006527 TaxID=3364749 RepID=UPI0036843E05
MVNLDFTVSAAMVLVPALVLFAVLVLLRDRVSSPGRAALAGAGISLAFERTQMLSYILFSSGRSVDINDVIANTLGKSWASSPCGGPPGRGRWPGWCRSSPCPPRARSASPPPDTGTPGRRPDR